jgi:hypothetical protein
MEQVRPEGPRAEEHAQREQAQEEGPRSSAGTKSSRSSRSASGPPPESA